LVLAQVDGAELITVIHPTAVVSRAARLGTGIALLAGSTVAAGAQLGDGVLLNTASSADHDCQLGAFSSLAPGARLGGKSVLEEGASICMGALVREATRVGAWSVVGAGATVLHDVPSTVVAYGTPARVIRTRKRNDSYLR
jgi:sugar O-acyltransferase (sialic acid O-acetyltransferase NeuD family)